MSDHYNAFEISPVPVPGPDAVAPEPFRGIYGMPAFVTVPTGDLAASADFWIRGLGFVELFAIPGRLVHLRRWAFQDVLLVAGPAMASAPELRCSFACVLGQLDDIVAACRDLDPSSVDGSRDTPWNTRDVEVITPENARVVMTAAKPLDAGSQQAADLAALGITPPSDDERDNDGGA